jgi:hypothetical protein
MNTLAGKFAKFRALTGAERRVLLAALLWLPLFWLGLQMLGLQRFQRWLQRKPLGTTNRLPLEEIRRLGTLVNIAARYAPGPVTCLTRSLLLCWLLRRKGLESKLRIGVRLTDVGLDAHAWVEYAGAPVNDRPDVDAVYAPFDKAISASAFTSP